MASMLYKSIKYPSKLQVEVWLLSRNQLPGKEIASKKQISNATVSKNLTIANKRVKSLLENAALMNKIHIDLMSEKLGYVRGYSHVFNLTVYITYSPINGIHVWYDHPGQCENCEDFVLCRKLLLQEFKERNIVIPNRTLRPSGLSALLFQKIEELLE